MKASLLRGSALVLAITGTLGTQVPSVGAQVPWGDKAPVLDGDVLRVAALGQPDHRIHAWGARRLSARHRAEARARATLHRWVDDALADAGAAPHLAQAVHALVDGAVVTAVRPLADGSAVVVLTVPRHQLRAAAPLEGVPW